MKPLIAVSLVAAGLFGVSACESLEAPMAAQELANEAIDGSMEFDLEEISCWEVLSASEEATDYALTILYGYAAGKAGDNIQSGDKIERVITAAADTCATNPDLPAYESFK